MAASRRPSLAKAAACLVAASVVLCAAPPASAVVEQSVVSARVDDAAFPMPTVVRQQKRFWELVFYRYPSTSIIVNEAGYPEKLIDVIDYRHLDTKYAKPVPRREREEIAKKYVKRYAKAVDRFVHEGKSAVHYGPIEARLLEVYGGTKVGLDRLLRGDLKVRAQTGLADDFLAAATAAQVYLPTMERIFARYGLPTRLTRLPFVESMFNLHARSKVGASGIWQFMPETARNFVFVNSLVDERNAPFKATRAAAQFLLANFRELGSWPLAITAYNHGAEGMAKAVRQIGSKDIGKIISDYDSPSFGFASSNFYSEFLAANSAYDRLVRQHRIGVVDTLPDSEPVILQRPVTVAELLRHTGLSQESLAAMNPCLLDSAFTTGVTKPLPAYYEIRVPPAAASTLRAALARITTKRYVTQ